MKTLKSILILSLCIFFISSCKKDNDLGGGNYSTGKVAFERLGMQAYFPKNEWGNQDSTRNELYEMKGLFTFLKESKVMINNRPSYTVHISFWRFTPLFEDENKANGVINEIKEIYDYWTTTETGKEYLYVEPITSSQIGDYPAKKMKCKKINGSIEESYFIYQGKNLYWIAVVIPEDKIDDYYAECMEIINSLKITN